VSLQLTALNRIFERHRLSFEDADFIAYEESTSRHHQEHIIAHEFAHIIYGHHGTVRADDTQTLSNLFPDLNPSLVDRLLHRGNCSNTQEREAEYLATILLAQMTSRANAISGEEARRASQALGIHD
jgi:hypothetical protein